MEHDEAKKVDGQIQGITAEGWIRSIRTDDEGKLLVSDGGSGEVKYPSTFICQLVEEEKTFEVNKFVTNIYIANYDSEKSITVTIDESANVLTVGANIALDIPVGKTISSVVIGGETVKAQILIETID